MFLAHLNHNLVVHAPRKRLDFGLTDFMLTPTISHADAHALTIIAVACVLCFRRDKRAAKICEQICTTQCISVWVSFIACVCFIPLPTTYSYVYTLNLPYYTVCAYVRIAHGSRLRTLFKRPGSGLLCEAAACVPSV